MAKGSKTPTLSLPTRPLKEMTNDPEGMSLTVRSNPGKVQELSAHGSSNGAGHGADKSTSHDSSNSMDICQQRASPVQCLERDVRARSPSKSMAFHGVPEDVYVNFLQYMSLQHLSKVSQVSRQLRKQCLCNTMWKNLCLEDFGEDASIITDTYRDAFAQAYDSNASGFYQRIYRSMLDFRIDISFLQGPRANEEPCKISKIETTNIGRSRQNDICILQDEMVSRKHGKIIPKARRYMLQDLGSINGTFINTKQVATQTTVQLRLGDEVEMGNSVFKIVLVVPDPNEDEATTLVDDHDIQELHNDEEMGDDEDIVPPHDDDDEALYVQDSDDEEDDHMED